MFGKYLKIVSVLLVLSLILTACGGAKEGSSPAPVNSSDPAQSPSGQKEKLELNWNVIAGSSFQLPSADKDFVKKAIEEKFNVDLKLTYMPMGSDYKNKLNTMIASGDIPDVFFSEGIDSNAYIKDGVARDLTGIVTPESMPNYFKYWVKEDTLKMYQVQGVFKRAPIPYETDLYRTFYIRQDWLDKLKLNIPTTYDELIAVMKAFTEQDPDGNNKNDTYGFTAAGNGTNISMDFPQFLNNGMVGDTYVENDNLIDVRTDIRMEGILNDIKKLIDMKIVDPDWLLNKNGQQYEKAQQGKVGIVLGMGRDLAFDNNPAGLQMKTKQITNNPNANWVPFHPWEKTGTWIETIPGNPFVISSKSPDEKVKRSIEILDWLAGEEGFLMTRYGLEGVHYKRDGQKIEVNQEAYTKDIVDNGNFIEIYGWFTPRKPEVFGFDIIDPNITERDKQIVEKIRSYKILPSVGTSLGIKEGMDLGGMRKRMNELLIQVLFKDKDASKWPGYRQEIMNKYGGKAIFDYYAEQVSTAQGKTITFKAEN
ncbi:extracellular solute-binding protein [Paenibacillus eucommiae]|uniref:Aldouronate transport system substrate-binding protein n=1 Tax=Paenibacillus eucommiae TaxID=1355755 RepID=A0ABS4J6Z8_9BACL|nr:extracellular solute-binding protein [Paenibacillus eucommiae]MBP1995578.1 putative aldouronate transport system substrate-binding protein [Paenibacillus eucommiae]